MSAKTPCSPSLSAPILMQAVADCSAQLGWGAFTPAAANLAARLRLRTRPFARSGSRSRCARDPHSRMTGRRPPADRHRGQSADARRLAGKPARPAQHKPPQGCVRQSSDSPHMRRNRSRPIDAERLVCRYDRDVGGAKQPVVLGGMPCRGFPIPLLKAHTFIEGQPTLPASSLIYPAILARPREVGGGGLVPRCSQHDIPEAFRCSACRDNHLPWLRIAP